MVELRVLVYAATRRVLQYRVLTPCVDASGALCPGGVWGPWIAVPDVLAPDAKEHELQTQKTGTDARSDEQEH
jgi:hypothetical protein